MHIHRNYVCWGFAASFSLLLAFECRTLPAALKSLVLTAAAGHCRGSTVLCCFHQRGNFFPSLIDGCLKYKNKEKPKTGPRPGPRLNGDVKIGPKPGPRDVKKSGPVGPGLKCRALVSVLALPQQH